MKDGIGSGKMRGSGAMTESRMMRRRTGWRLTGRNDRKRYVPQDLGFADGIKGVSEAGQ